MGANSGIIPGVETLEPDFVQFLVQVVVILSVCESLSWIGVYLHQPRVIFEILGGIILGPSILGNIPSFSNLLFPSSSLSILTVVAQLGLNFYIFIIGLELDYTLFVYNFTKTGSIAIISMIIPFALGIAVSPLLYRVVQVPNSGGASFESGQIDQQFISFFVFIGTALSITAFPVLARIINETPLKHTNIGGITLSAAAINDAVAWILLVIAISLARSTSSLVSLYLILGALFYTILLFTVVRYLLTKIIFYFENEEVLFHRNPFESRLTSGEAVIAPSSSGIASHANDPEIVTAPPVAETAEPQHSLPSQASPSHPHRLVRIPSSSSGMKKFNLEKRLHHLFVLMLILCLASAYFISLLGIDSIIGSLLFGIILPRESKIYHYCLQHVTYLTIYFFLPIYFATSGLKTNFTTLSFFPDFWLLLLVCFIATVGKVSGAGLMAYYFGYQIRESLVIAILMNTRGLVELIVLNIGYNAAILNEQIFAMLVIMCLVTTMMSYPLVAWIYQEEISEVKLRRREERGGGGAGGGNEEMKVDIDQHHRHLPLPPSSGEGPSEVLQQQEQHQQWNSDNNNSYYYSGTIAIVPENNEEKREEDLSPRLFPSSLPSASSSCYPISTILPEESLGDDYYHYPPSPLPPLHQVLIDSQFPTSHPHYYHEERDHNNEDRGTIEVNRATSQSEIGSDTTSVLVMTLMRGQNNNNHHSNSNNNEETLSVSSYSFQQSQQPQEDLEEGNRPSSFFLESEEGSHPPTHHPSLGIVSFFSSVPLPTSSSHPPRHTLPRTSDPNDLFLEEIDLES